MSVIEAVTKPKKNQSNTLLFVEDSEEDYEIFLRAIKKTDIEFEFNHCETGEDALSFLRNQKNYADSEKFKKPCLVLLDLNLPGIDGKKVLEKIKSDPHLKLIPVVIFSTSSNPRDVEDCYIKGANAYVIKPMNFSLLQQCIQTLLSHWLDFNVTCNQ